MTALPSWVAKDPVTLRRDNTPVIETYHHAYSDGQRRLAFPGERDKVESAAYYLAHMADEVIAPCVAALGNSRVREKPIGKAKLQEGFIWLGWIPHHLAHGLGWRMRPACEIFARHGHPQITADFHLWADTFLIRAQAMLDGHNAMGRKDSRITANAAPLFQLLVDDARNGLTKIVAMLCLDPKTAKLLKHFERALEKTY